MTRVPQRPAPAGGDPDVALAGVLTDERLLGWGAAEGLDLTDRAQLLDAAAVGLTILLWRHTEVEHIHAGVELTPAAGDDAGELTDRLDAALDADVAGYRGVADSAEATRLQLLLEQRRTTGAGIPDDVLMRCNISTARAVRAALDAALPAAAANPGAELPMPAGELPGYLAAAADVLRDPTRPLTVGPVAVPVGELLGEDGWVRYVGDLHEQLTRPVAIALAIGARRALWYVALSGATYGGDWWPATPHWAAAVADLRAAVAAGDLGRALWPARVDRPQPAPGDEQFWAALTDTPERLNAVQVQWVIGTRLSQLLTERRMAGAAAAGAANAERFPAVAALC